MPDRLPIPASRVADVAKAAHVSEATVLRYRQTRGDGSLVHDLHPASLYLIEQAVRGLPPSAQLEICTSTLIVTSGNSPGGVLPPSAAVDPYLGRGSALAEAKPANGGGRAILIATKPGPRPRLVLEMPEGVEAPEPDGRHWYEERETA